MLFWRNLSLDTLAVTKIYTKSYLYKKGENLIQSCSYHLAQRFHNPLATQEIKL